MPSALTMRSARRWRTRGASWCCGPSRPPTATPSARRSCSGCRIDEVRAELLALLNGAADAAPSTAPVDDGCGARRAEARARAGTRADRRARGEQENSPRRVADRPVRGADMSRHDFDDDEPYVVIEKHGGGRRRFPARRRDRRRRRAAASRRDRARRRAATSGVGASRSDSVRRRGERRDATPSSTRSRGAPRRRADRLGASGDRGKKEQVQRAMEAGRAAAHQAREELERRIAETKAAYRRRRRRARAPAGRRAGDARMRAEDAET